MANEIPLLEQLANDQLPDSARDYLSKATEEIRAGVSARRFSALFSMASRYAKREPLNAPSPVNQVRLDSWNQLELLRVSLLLARPDLQGNQFAEDFESLFRFADEGESCALYRATALLPDPSRFVWRAGEGCRSNMLSIFNAVAIDSPYPAKYFGDTAWNQLVMKAVFVEARVDRILGLDSRLSPELSRMALDFAAERKSAGRDLFPGFWLLPGKFHTEALLDLVKDRWSAASARDKACMALALGRAEAMELLVQLTATDQEPKVQRALSLVNQGQCSQSDLASYLADK